MHRGTGENVVEPFTKELIARVLERDPFPFTVGENGMFESHFPNSPFFGDCEWEFNYDAIGEKEEIFYFGAMCNRFYDDRFLGDLLLVLNEWNTKSFGPTPRVQLSGGFARVVFEFTLDCSPGIHQDLLEKTALSMREQTFMFATWLQREHSDIPNTVYTNDDDDEVDYDD